MASRRSGTRSEKATLNLPGTSPDWRSHDSPKLEVHQRDGASASFDFARTYSTHRNVDHLAERFQRNDARSVPNADDGDPFAKAATAAWLSTHRAHVRFLPLGHFRARQTMSTESHSSKMKIGDSHGTLLTMSMSQFGRWADAAVLFSPASTAAMCPRP